MTDNLSVYIPFIHKSCSEEIIKYVFNNLFIGRIQRVELVAKRKNWCGFVYFYSWYDNIASINLRNKINNGGKGKIVYNEPYYWNIYKNTSTSNVLRLPEHLLNMIKELEQRIYNMESTRISPYLIAPPPPNVNRHKLNFYATDDDSSRDGSN